MSQKRGMKFIILHIDNHQTFPQTEPINLGGHGEACFVIFQERSGGRS